MSGPTAVQNHVVNDVVDGIPVTVTYCDRMDCTRVFTADGGDPLAIGVTGYSEGLLIRAPGGRYRLDNCKGIVGPDQLQFPYQSMEFVVTTWKEWRDAHPNTDVIVRVSPPGAQ